MEVEQPPEENSGGFAVAQSPDLTCLKSIL
jgi:hypothetical protein